MNKTKPIYKSFSFQVNNLPVFKKQALSFANKFDTVINFDSNKYHNEKYGEYEGLLACGVISELLIEKEKGAFEKIKRFYNDKKNWLFGYFSYDLKNDTENLYSSNYDNLKFPGLYFFQPEYIIEIFKNKVIIHSSKEIPEILFKKINNKRYSFGIPNNKQKKRISKRIPSDAYLKTIKTIKHHILQGDIYEMNFCQEFYLENTTIDPIQIFLKLNALSKAPFSIFLKIRENFLLSASPERFLKKKGKKLISQPIKGTIKRGKTKEEDDFLKTGLKKSQKDLSENIMIVDLVRNDLARSCKTGSVKVDELCEIYGFEHVFQMISTISGELREEIHFIDAIKNAFPPGSMTGAPKIRAMQLIEKYEKTKRGLFSGVVGYIKPNGDFDFNVVIRSILYSQKRKYVSIQAGGAIVFDSDPQKELDESFLKAEALLSLFDQKTI